MTNDIWYYSKGLKPQGPVALEEIRKKIVVGEIGPWDLVSVEGRNSEWKAACEWREFESRLFPAFQMADIDMYEEKDPQWVLLRPAAEGKTLQEGPFTLEQISVKLQQNDISPVFYIWKAGLTGWCRIRDRFAPHGKQG